MKGRNSSNRFQISARFVMLGVCAQLENMATYGHRKQNTIVNNAQACRQHGVPKLTVANQQECFTDWLLLTPGSTVYWRQKNLTYDAGKVFPLLDTHKTKERDRMRSDRYLQLPRNYPVLPQYSHNIWLKTQEGDSGNVDFHADMSTSCVQLAKTTQRQLNTVRNDISMTQLCAKIFQEANK